VTQELEFHISVTQVGENNFLVRTERVFPGVPLAQEQISWPVGEWLDQARQLMNDPLVELWQGRAKPPIEPRKNHQSGVEEGSRVHNLVALGRQLYTHLFQGTLQTSWVAAQSIAQHNRSKLRLRLGVRGPLLPRLPWEVLHAGNRPLATGTDVFFSRYEPSLAISLHPAPEAPANALKPLKILMVLAGPTDQESLELKREALHLQQELQSRGYPGSVNAPMMQLTILEQPDRNTLTQALEQNQYQVFHYAGHSNFGASGGELYLVSRTTGLTETLTGYDLAGLLANNGIQLAVLNSCRGVHAATQSYTDESEERHLAQALIKHGIPAVLAMAERIPDDVALTLARLFYRNLSQGYAVDSSLNRARQGLIVAYGSDQLYWALPILYLHPEFNGYLSSHHPVQLPLSASSEEVLLSASRTSRSGNLPPQMPEFDSEAWAKSMDADLEGILHEVAYDELDLHDPYLDSDYDHADYDDLAFDDPAYDDLSEEEDSAVVADLLRQLVNPEPATEDPSAVPEGIESLFTDAEIEKYELETAPPLAATSKTPPAQETETPAQLTIYHSKPTAKPAQLASVASPSKKIFSQSKWMIGALGVGIVALVGAWFLRGAIFQARQPDVDSIPVPSLTASPTLQPADLQKATSAQVVAIATESLIKGDIAAGQQAVEALLDRGALQHAETALAAVPNPIPDAGKNEPVINFLKGRLAWQSAQTGKQTKYNIEDAQRYWYAAVQGNPQSLAYRNALGFAYYANGDLDRASQSWLEIRKLAEANFTQTTTTPAPITQEVLSAHAGIAMIFWKQAQTLPPDQKATRFSKAVKIRNYVISQDAASFQKEALAKNWLWTENEIKDWLSVLQLKEEG
jgi:hypothetical protein